MIGRKDTDDFCLHTDTSVIACIKPDQLDLGFSGELVNLPVCHKMLHLISGKNVYDVISCLNGFNLMLDNPLLDEPRKLWILIPLFLITSSVSFLFCTRVTSLLLLIFPGWVADIIPIPWNVSFPVKVLMLWSTLSATHCVKLLLSSIFSTPFILSTTDCFYLNTSLYDIQ